jgi:hypothetical protein
VTYFLKIPHHSYGLYCLRYAFRLFAAGILGEIPAVQVACLPTPLAWKALRSELSARRQEIPPAQIKIPAGRSKILFAQSEIPVV